MNKLFGIIWFLGTALSGLGQHNPPVSRPMRSLMIEQLEMKVYQFNNSFLYDSSILLLKQKIDNPASSYQDRYYCFLYLSYTHKRLFDYKATLRYLDSALVYGLKASHAAYFEANIQAQKAFALFDTHHYEEAAKLMEKMVASKFAYLDDEQKAKIIMQLGYLSFLEKKFELSEKQYKEAIHYLTLSSPCDLPMIYAKQIQLYGSMHNTPKMQEALNRSLRMADSCKIMKYSIYTYQMLQETYEKQGNIKGAYQAFKRTDSLNRVYKQEEYLSNLKDIEAKYQKEKFEIKSQLANSIIRNQRDTLLMLLEVIIITITLVALYAQWQRQKRLKREKENSIKFTKQLLQTSEEERHRIASDLHDSISHELLTLKSLVEPHMTTINNKIDTLINDIRSISRNLHPVMFDKIGLTPNIEALVERLQSHNDFMVSTDIAYEGSLNSADELQLYRIIQEALSNVIKYANAHAARVSLYENNHQIQMEIKDNGRGFDVGQALNSGKAFGLHNIIERSRVIGGTAKIHSSSAGTVITVTISKKNKTNT